jgi:endonuclease/exonuclease/phosphatase (EEP) superfamily protein YafD
MIQNLPLIDTELDIKLSISHSQIVILAGDVNDLFWSLPASYRLRPFIQSLIVAAADNY